MESTLIGRTVTGQGTEDTASGAPVLVEHVTGRPVRRVETVTGHIIGQAPQQLAPGNKSRRAYWLLTEDGRYFAVRGPFCDGDGYHSKDQIEVFDGHEEPRYLCGFHASQRQLAS